MDTMRLSGSPPRLSPRLVQLPRPSMPRPSEAYIRLRKRANARKAKGAASRHVSAPEVSTNDTAKDKVAAAPESVLRIHHIDMREDKATDPVDISLIEEDDEPITADAWRVVETPVDSGSVDSGSVEATPPPATPPGALASSTNMLPRRRWDQPNEPPLVRGPTYLEDSVKVHATGGPVCTLFAAQMFELVGEHMAGASAALLQRGTTVPPPDAKTVLTLHFMCPRTAKSSPHFSFLLSFATERAVDDITGGVGELLRELWSGDAANALSRCKVLCSLRSGPPLVRASLSWLGLDDTRPMLLCRQVHASLNRATLPHLGASAVGAGAEGTGSGASAGPTTYQHMEIAFDLAASPLCNQIMKYAWASLPSVDVTLCLVLEARTAEELPEHHLALFAINGLEPSEIAPQPPTWPTSEAAIPGEMVGAYVSGRAAGHVGSWQSSRAIVTEDKGGGGMRSAFRSSIIGGRGWGR